MDARAVNRLLHSTLAAPVLVLGLAAGCAGQSQSAPATAQATSTAESSPARAHHAERHCPTSPPPEHGHPGEGECVEPGHHHASREHHHAPPEEHGHGHVQGHGHDTTAPTVDHRFEDPEHWAKVFDDPARDAWQKPQTLVGVLGLSPDSRVADIGTGTGYFVPHLARAVPKGTVLAIDLEPKLLEHVKQRAAKAKLANVQTILAEKDDPKLPKDVNVVLVVDTYHHIGKRQDYFRAVQSKLAQGGRVVIVDFRKGKLPVGPPDPHKLAPDTVTAEMKNAGYELCREHDILPHQYVLSFGRPGQC